MMDSGEPLSIASDARVVRTRRALREAMTMLVAERPLEAITVRAIAARAGVGYATFFRHYVDKDALLSDVADVLTAELLQRIAPLLQQRNRLAAAQALCAFVDERRPICTALIAGGAGDTVRAEMLRQSMARVALARPAKPEGVLDDLILFHTVSATLNLLAWWLRRTGEVDPLAMAEIIERTVLTPAGSLRRQPPSGI
jgi:AcrR family transcriptional regulator